jgi:acid phosphatase
MLAIPAFAALAGCQADSVRPIDPAGERDIPAFTIPSVRPETAYERFMVIGDMGTGRPDQYRVADAMARRARTDGLNFILTVGDNFYPRGVLSIDDPQWETKFEDVYADPTLQVPVYATLGNHDRHGSIEAQIEYTHHNDRWQMLDKYYTFTRTLADETRIQFYAVDTTPIHDRERGITGQLTWLERELAASDARWKIVFGHHPLYSHSSRGNDGAMINRLEPLFVEHGVDVYFAGHDHTLEMLKPVNGVHYVVSGAGGGPDKAYAVNWTDEAYYAATLGGFAFVRASKDELVIEFVRLDAATQYAHTIMK